MRSKMMIWYSSDAVDLRVIPLLLEVSPFFGTIITMPFNQSSGTVSELQTLENNIFNLSMTRSVASYFKGTYTKTFFAGTRDLTSYY